jgi:hypothetical protein
MIEKLVALRIPPGLYRNGTQYQSKGRWYDGNLVRFLEGTIQPVGGWRTALNSDGTDLDALAGVIRAIHAWRDSGGDVQIGLGTNTRAYVLINGVLTDITPASGFTAGEEDSELVSGAYGSGTYGTGIYGTGSLASAITEAGVWQLDNFGDSLVGVMTADGDLLVWDGNVANNFAAAANAPTANRAVVVTPERFLVALGAGGNPRKVQWADQESSTTWTGTATNAAGEFELATNGRLMCGRRGRGNTLLWTDVDLWDMTFIGGELIFGFTRIADSCGIIGPNAVAMVDGRAFWMGRDGFFVFDGAVSPLPCEVRDRVFEDFNVLQSIKVCAVPIAQYGEVWWFYPSSGSTENDRYVVFNYRENHWSFGTLARTGGADRGAAPLPLLGEPAYAAQGTLTSDTTNVSDGDTVTIGSKVYTFEATLTDVDGNVQIGADAEASLLNLFRAINLSGTAGTHYATSMTRHPSVTAEAATATTLLVRARAAGTAGNAIATEEDSTHLVWGAEDLAGGANAATGYRVSNLKEHEILEDRDTEVPYLESGPIEAGEGDNVFRVQRIVPDENSLGDVQATFYTALYPLGDESVRGPYTLANPTNVRFSARQLRIRLTQVVETSWRVGTIRLGGILGGRR